MSNPSRAKHDSFWKKLLQFVKKYWSGIVGWLCGGGAASVNAFVSNWMPLEDRKQFKTAFFLMMPVACVVLVILALVCVATLGPFRVTIRRVLGCVVLLVCLGGLVVATKLFYVVEDYWKTRPSMDYFVYLIVEPLCWGLPFGFLAALIAVSLLLIKDLATGRGGI